MNTVSREMAEGGFDPCECVCSQEYAMRRLINLVSHEPNLFLLCILYQSYGAAAGQIT